MTMLLSWRLAQVVLLLISLVSCDYNSSEICSWDRPRVALIRDHIYLEGGWLQLAEDGSCRSPATPDSSIGWLFNLSLYEPFDIAGHDLPAIFQSVYEGTITNFYFDGYMFADYDEFYAWGGMSYISGDTVWKFTVSTPLYDAPPGSNVQLGKPNTNYAPESENFLPRTNGAGANAPSENLGFYFGGMWNSNGDKFTSTVPPKNRSTDLIKVNTYNQGHADWQIYPLNESITPWRAEGGLVWLPASTHGLLVVIGGVTAPADLSVDQENATYSQNFLKQFPIYDIGSNKWALQDLDGSSPFPDAPLAQFCMVVASNPNGSHHDIFIYGGSDGNYSMPNADVWVLSVPSFTWIKVDSTERAGVPRQGHTCTTPYPDQMIVIGGSSIGGSPLELNQAVDVYNLNDLNWTGSYDPDPDANHDYQPHQIIQDVISNKPIADNISPQVAGWFDQKYNMDKIKFYGPYRREVPEVPPAGNNTAPNSTIPNPPAEHHSDRGWVVPVAAAVPSGSVAIIVILVFLLFRRKKKLEAREDNTEATEANQRKSWIVPWLWATHPPQKEVGSDTVTEVEQVQKSPPMSPPPQELEGTQRDGYFTPGDMNENTRQRWSSTTPARSPLGDYVGPVEGPDNPVHEVEGGHRTVASDQINYDIRNLPHYPPTIVSGGNHGFVRGGSLSSPDEYQLSGPLETGSPSAPGSPRGVVAYPDSGPVDQDAFGPLGRTVSPIANRQNQRPGHNRHNSSVSSGLSLPSPDLEQSPRSMPRASRSLSGEHNNTAPSDYGQDDIRGNHTF